MTEEFFEKKGWEVGYDEAFPHEDYTEEDLIALEKDYQRQVEINVEEVNF